MVDIIPYNPDQSGRAWKTIREILTDNRPIRSENSELRCDNDASPTFKCENMYKLYLWMLEEHYCLISTS